MGWLISAGIIILGFMSGVSQGVIGGRDSSLICVFWGVVGVFWCLLFVHCSLKKQEKKRHMPVLFIPYRADVAYRDLAQLCSHIIWLTPEKKRETIEIHLYAGEQNGDKCKIGFSITNFKFRNLRTMFPGYYDAEYLDSIGWEISEGMVALKETIEVELPDNYARIWVNEGKAAAYGRILSNFTRNCLEVREEGNHEIQEDGFFMRYKVK